MRNDSFLPGRRPFARNNHIEKEHPRLARPAAPPGCSYYTRSMSCSWHLSNNFLIFLKVWMPLIANHRRSPVRRTGARFSSSSAIPQRASSWEEPSEGLVPATLLFVLTPDSAGSRAAGFPTSLRSGTHSPSVRTAMPEPIAPKDFTENGF